MKIEIITSNDQQTRRLGQLLAMELRGGEIISLQGDLGGGKTTFTQGLAAALKIKEKIISPTFVVLKKYPVPHPKIKYLYHLDLYRLRDPQEILDLGFEEILSRPENVMIIEWAEKARAILPPEKNIKIHFLFLGKNSRKITFFT